MKIEKKFEHHEHKKRKQNTQMKNIKRPLKPKLLIG
jgi:hypothetical protein